MVLIYSSAASLQRVVDANFLLVIISRAYM